MFKRKHHLVIADILRQLNGDLLRDHHCYFGGGTAIALSQEEYRESVDIDFLISDKDCYRELRNLLTDSQGIYAIAKKGAKLILARDIKADQYGIRSVIQSGDVRVKFEIVLEGRITFENPGSQNQIEGITTLTKLDLLASKLLANSDRWNDEAVFSRDLIDFVMLNPKAIELEKALEKSYDAYGNSVHKDLQKAIDDLLSREGKLEKSIKNLQIYLPKALLWQKLKDLRASHLAYLEKQRG